MLIFKILAVGLFLYFIKSLLDVDNYFNQKFLEDPKYGVYAEKEKK